MNSSSEGKWSCRDPYEFLKSLQRSDYPANVYLTCRQNIWHWHTSVRGPAQVVSSNLDMERNTCHQKILIMCLGVTQNWQMQVHWNGKWTEAFCCSSQRNNETHGILTQTHREDTGTVFTLKYICHILEVIGQQKIQLINTHACVCIACGNVWGKLSHWKPVVWQWRKPWLWNVKWIV